MNESGERHQIGGIWYVPITGASAEHDCYLVQKVARAGLDEVHIRAEESREAWSRRFLMRIMASGEALEILGALFVPETIGVAAWSPEVARQTARAFGALRDRDEKETIFGLLLGAVLSFFELGLTSVTTSETS